MDGLDDRVSIDQVVVGDVAVGDDNRERRGPGMRSPLRWPHLPV